VAAILLALAAAAVVVAALVAVAAVAALVSAPALALVAGGLGRRRRGGGGAAEQAAQPADHAAGRDRLRCRYLRHRGGLGLRFRPGFAQRRRLGRLHLGHRRWRRDVQLRLGQRDGVELARGAALVAGPGGFLAHLVLADAG